MIKVIKKEKQMMEKTIKEWAINMVQIYTWLTIKFEYSERFRTILIDLVYPPQYGNDEDFHRDALAFNDKMCKVYGDNAPLFTNNEKLFKLSDKAQVICIKSYLVQRISKYIKIIKKIMIKVIKHGTAFHAYKCSKCECIFTASKKDIETEDINGLLYCPECGYYIFEHDIIDDQEIIKDKLFEKVNVPSCWKVGEHDKKYEAINTSATTYDCIKRY